MSAWSVSGTASSPRSPTGSYPASRLAEPPVGDEHPDRLDGVERDARRRARRSRAAVVAAARARARRAARASRSRRAARASRARKLRRAGAPVGPPLEQLRPGEREDQDRDAAAPLEQVVDEVEQARVGPVQVLEDEDDGARRGDPLEERPPRREELLAPARRRRLARRAAPAARGSIQRRSASSGTYSAERRGDLLARRRLGRRSRAARARPRTISPSAQKVIPSP